LALLHQWQSELKRHCPSVLYRVWRGNNHTAAVANAESECCTEC
jgi:hypothetical protein